MRYQSALFWGVVALGSAVAGATTTSAQPIVATSQSSGLVCHLLTPSSQRGQNIQVSGERSPLPGVGTPCEEPISHRCGFISLGVVSVTPMSAALSAPRLDARVLGDADFRASCAGVSLAALAPSAGTPIPVAAPPVPPAATIVPPAALPPTVLAAVPSVPPTPGVSASPAYACRFTSGPLNGYTLMPTSAQPLIGPPGTGCSDGYGSSGTQMLQGLACQFTQGPLRGMTIAPIGLTLSGPPGQPCDDHYGNYGVQVQAVAGS